MTSPRNVSTIGSTEAPKTPTSSLTIDQLGEPWERKKGWLRSRPQDSPQAWCAQLERERMIVLGGVHTGVARECLRVAFERPPFKNVPVQHVLHTDLAELDQDCGADRGDAGSTDAYREGDGVADEASHLEQALGGSPVEGGEAPAEATTSAAPADHHPVQQSTAGGQEVAHAAPYGQDPQTQDDTQAGNDSSKVRTLADVLARGRGQDGALILVVDFLEDKEIHLARRFLSDGPPQRERTQRLTELRSWVVVVLGIEHLRAGEDAWRKAARLENNEHEQQLLKRQIDRTDLEENARVSKLAALLSRLFEKEELKRFLNKNGLHELKDWIEWERAEVQVHMLVAEGCVRRGEHALLLDPLLAARPGRRDEILAEMEQIAATTADLQARLRALDLERQALLAEPVDAGGDASWSLTRLDLRERLIRAHVDSPTQERHLREQISAGQWGHHEDEIVGHLADAAATGTLAEHIQRIQARKGIDVDLLGLQGHLYPTILFVASFVDSLTPWHFRIVVESLLILEVVERPEERRVPWASGEASANEADAEPDEDQLGLLLWRQRSDQIMDVCGLQVVHPHSPGQSPQVKWRIPPDERDWRTYLSSRRHYFVERKLLQLQRSHLLLLDQKAGEDLFELLLSMLVEQSSANPEILADHWLGHHLRLLAQNRDSEKMLVSVEEFFASKDAALSAEDKKRIALGQMVANEEKHINRLGRVLRAMQEHRGLRQYVRALLRSLIEGSDDLHRAWCLGLLKEMRGAKQFDDIDWLCQLFNGGGARARTDVYRTLVRYGRDPRSRDAVAAALPARLPDEEQKMVTPNAAMLALDVALALALRRGLGPERVPLGEHPLTAPMLTRGPPGASLPWLLRTLVRLEARARALHVWPEHLKDAISSLLRPLEGEPGARKAVADALLVRWRDVLRARLGRRYQWYARDQWPALEGLYAAQILVDLVLSADAAAGAPQETVLLGHLRATCETVPATILQLWRFHWEALDAAFAQARPVLQASPGLDDAKRSRIYDDLTRRRASVQTLYHETLNVRPRAEEPHHAR